MHNLTLQSLELARKQAQNDMRVKDLVVLRIDSIASNEWRLGRVVEFHRCHDGRLRLVSLKTQNKLVLLPRAQ